MLYQKNNYKFITKFLAKKLYSISQIIQTSKQKQKLTQEEWSQTIKEIDNLTTSILEIYIQTCAKPTPQLMHKVKQQGGCLPINLQKQ
jgi:hypothetical protein